MRHVAATPTPLARRLALLPSTSAQVPQSMTAEQLRPTFEQFGSILDITIILDKTTRVSKGERRAPDPCAHAFASPAVSSEPPPPPSARAARQAAAS